MNGLIKICVAIFLFALTGCVESNTATAAKVNQLAMSSVRDMALSYPTTSVFSITPRYLDKVSFPKEQMMNFYQLYADAISASLTEKGYVKNQSDKKETAKFNVVFGVALTKDLSDQTISEKFGVMPGLQVHDNLEKGSFLIYIEDVATGQKVWRGAIQGFVHKELSEKERAERVPYIVNKLMSQFYNVS